MTQVAPGKQRLGLQPIQNGKLVVTQLLVGVGLPTALDYHTIGLPRPVFGAGQRAAITLEIGHDDGRRQDADQVNFGTVPHRVCNGNNPVGAVCPAVFQPFQKDLEHLVFVRAVGLLAINEDGHWLPPSQQRIQQVVDGLIATLN